MPINLNALLRYKTIDKCIQNTFVPATIEQLIEKCSEALSDKKGEKISVSERTIRYDLRMLRSDLLEFNAPIICENGVYRYADAEFKLFDQPIADKELLIEIQLLLLEEFDNFESEKVKYLLVALARITGEKIPRKCLPKDYDIFPKRMPGSKLPPSKQYENNLNNCILSFAVQKRKKKSRFGFFKKPVPIVKGFLTWEYVVLGLETSE